MTLFETLIEDQNVKIAFVLGVGFVFSLVAALLFQSTKRALSRGSCLVAAKLATEDFYTKAEILVSDPGLPEPLKDMILDMALAVTNPRAGKKAINELMHSLSEIKSKGDLPRPKRDFVDTLDLLRKSRGDLYDDFQDALRVAFAAIIYAYGRHHEKIEISYNATNSKWTLLSVAERLDRVITDWQNQKREKEVWA